MSEQKTNTVAAEQINEVVNDPGKSNQDLSLEALILLVNAQRLTNLQKQTTTEFKDLKARQEQVSFLQKLIKKINVSVSQSGELDCTNNNELKEMLQKAKTMGVDIKEDLNKFNKNEKDALVENLRMTVDDLNVKNDMQLQGINRLTNERYEAYQMARSILKPLHDAKMKVAQGVR